MDRKPPAVTVIEIVLILAILAAACWTAGAHDLFDVLTNR